MKYLLRFLVLAVLVVVPSYALATPTITGVTGPQSIVVSQTGTWSFTATSNAPGGVTTFGVDYGDGTNSKNTQTQTSPTFNHAFAQAGTYKIRFTAIDSTGSNYSDYNVTVNPAPTIANVNIQGNQPVWIYQETTKPISWTYANVPTDQGLRFRYGAYDTVTRTWLNQAHFTPTQSSGTGTGLQTANLADISNLGRPAVIRVVLVSQGSIEYALNGTTIQATSNQTFTIKRRGTISFTPQSSSFIANSIGAKAQGVFSVNANNGDVYFYPRGSSLIVKNQNEVQIIVTGDQGTTPGVVTTWTTTDPNAIVDHQEAGFPVYKIPEGKGAKFNVSMTFSLDKLPTPGVYTTVFKTARFSNFGSDGASGLGFVGNIDVNLPFTGTVSRTTLPSVDSVSYQINLGQPILIKGAGLNGKAVTITNPLPTGVTPTYKPDGIEISYPTNHLVPGTYSVQIATLPRIWTTIISGTQPNNPPTTSRITSVVVNDFPTTWANNTSKSVTVSYEGIPAGKKIVVGLYTGLNGGTWNLPAVTMTVGRSGGFTTNITASVDVPFINKEHYVRALVVNADGSTYVGGASVQGVSANRFLVTSGSRASVDSDSQLANTEVVSQSLWQRFLNWLL